MEFRIKETQEIRELIIIDETTGIEWTQDLLGNHDALDYNEETEEYELSESDFEWWEDAIERLENGGKVDE